MTSIPWHGWHVVGVCTILATVCLSGSVRADAPVGASWVANYVATDLWSGSNSQAVSFGPLPQFTPLFTLGQAGDRLLVLNPATEGTAYVDADAVGPVGTPYPAVIFTATNGLVRLVHVEVADTPDEWERGLMGRQSLAPDSGMLFVFPGPETVAFWMKDTPLPLSIAFIDEQGQVLDVQDMAPETTTPHSSPAPYRFALEVSQGYFAPFGIGPGAHVTLSLSTPAG